MKKVFFALCLFLAALLIGCKPEASNSGIVKTQTEEVRDNSSHDKTVYYYDKDGFCYKSETYNLGEYDSESQLWNEHAATLTYYYLNYQDSEEENKVNTYRYDPNGIEETRCGGKYYDSHNNLIQIYESGEQTTKLYSLYPLEPYYDENGKLYYYYYPYYWGEWGWHLLYKYDEKDNLDRIDIYKRDVTDDDGNFLDEYFVAYELYEYNKSGKKIKKTVYKADDTLDCTYTYTYTYY